MSSEQAIEKPTTSNKQSTKTRHQPLREQIGMTEKDFMEIGAVGALYYEQGKLEKAQTIFEGLIELDPDNVDANSALGALYTRLQRDDDALRHLNRVLEIDDNQIAAHVNRAEVHIRKQDMEAAMVDLKRALELDPDEADAGANRARAIVLGIHEALEAKGVM